MNQMLHPQDKSIQYSQKTIEPDVKAKIACVVNAIRLTGPATNYCWRCFYYEEGEEDQMDDEQYLAQLSREAAGRANPKLVKILEQYFEDWDDRLHRKIVSALKPHIAYPTQPMFALRDTLSTILIDLPHANFDAIARELVTVYEPSKLVELTKEVRP